MCTALPFSVCGTIPYCIDEFSFALSPMKNNKASKKVEPNGNPKRHPSKTRRLLTRQWCRLIRRICLSMDQLLKDIQAELSVAKSFENIKSQQFTEDVVEG